jgi:hypothetical protein
VREHFAEVLALQLEHSSANTPAMERRGDLIRNIIPTGMRQWRAARAEAVLPFRGRLNVQGRDGTGLKTFVPWVRIHSPELSASAQNGWYVVYLFKADGNGVALCISHGSTRFDGRDFIPRKPEEASRLMAWARGLIGSEAGALGFRAGIDLGSTERLSKAYESTTAFSKMYDTADLPSDEALEADALKAAGLLGLLYRAEELGRAPDTTPPEVQEAEEAAEYVARPLKKAAKEGGGQGFGLTHAERVLVERHAMTMAEGWLTANGFTSIRDVSSNHSCDFLAERDGEEHVIEVKGTTASLGKILLTANEVKLHRARHPYNVLIVVHGVELLEARSKAYGGEISAHIAWQIAEEALTAISYVYALEPAL